MKIKKLLALLLVVGMTAALLGACGGGSKEAADEGKKIESADDLADAKIGVQTGTTGDIYCTDDYGDDHIERYNKGFEAVQALSQGKIDAVVIDNQPALEFVKDAEGLKILETPYTEEDYAMCFQKDSALVEDFNKVIKELQDDGTFDAIVAYYIEGKGERYASPEDVSYDNGEIVMATNAEFPPYEFKEGDEVVGLDADLAKAICDRLGYELKIEDMAFDSIIPAVQSGKAAFGAAGMTVTDERKTQVDFTTPYYTGKQVIIVKE